MKDGKNLSKRIDDRLFPARCQLLRHNSSGFSFQKRGRVFINSLIHMVKMKATVKIVYKPDFLNLRLSV